MKSSLSKIEEQATEYREEKGILQAQLIKLKLEEQDFTNGVGNIISMVDEKVTGLTAEKCSPPVEKIINNLYARNKEQLLNDLQLKVEAMDAMHKEDRNTLKEEINQMKQRVENLLLKIDEMGAKHLEEKDILRTEINELMLDKDALLAVEYALTKNTTQKKTSDTHETEIIPMKLNFLHDNCSDDWKRESKKNNFTESSEMTYDDIDRPKRAERSIYRVAYNPNKFIRNKNSKVMDNQYQCSSPVSQTQEIKKNNQDEGPIPSGIEVQYSSEKSYQIQLKTSGRENTKESSRKNIGDTLVKEIPDEEDSSNVEHDQKKCGHLKPSFYDSGTCITEWGSGNSFNTSSTFSLDTTDSYFSNIDASVASSIATTGFKPLMSQISLKPPRKAVAISDSYEIRYIEGRNPVNENPNVAHFEREDYT
eukprot:CAMPEP_0194293918 /NCGR_PEP_ID=MMETSP0169-20130528/49000_1 /TAXON_ID=218684 /ORGANISM="Corethron pennatum, Strain L29A3" /LENGTH=421 /DNA_ID=CAMNT_0039042597 /DNA_START=138 /DNA_END=1403 /DNA_ORIENTATION=-